MKDGFAIPMLMDKKEPRIPEFDEVKTKVANVIKSNARRSKSNRRRRICWRS